MESLTSFKMLFFVVSAALTALVAFFSGVLLATGLAFLAGVFLADVFFSAAAPFAARGGVLRAISNCGVVR